MYKLENFNKNKIKTKKAFTLVELSMVLVIVGLVVFGIVGGKSLIDGTKLSKAKSLTKSSPVVGMENLGLWIETTSDDSFDNKPAEDDAINNINDINPQVATGVGNATSTGGNEPTFKKNVQNGLPMLRFNGSNSLLTSINRDIAKPVTLFAVARFEDAGSEYPATLVGQGGYQILSTNGFITSDLHFNNLSVTYGDVQIYAMKHNGEGSDIIFYLNGESSNQGALNLFGMSLSENWIIGNDTNFDGMTGDVGEIIMFERALSESEINEVEAYLSNKWGINIQ